MKAQIPLDKTLVIFLVTLVLLGLLLVYVVNELGGVPGFEIFGD